MTTGTVRLQAFADLTGRSRETIRNAQKAHAEPWSERDFAKGAAQRQYTGFHALAEVLKEGLMAQNCSSQAAGFQVRIQASAIRAFLKEITEDLPVTQRFVIALQVGVEDDWLGPVWRQSVLGGYGTTEEMLDFITAEINRMGTISETRNGKTSERVICGPSIAMASIPEAYRLLRLRARNAGYRVEGYQIYKIATDTDDSEPEQEGTGKV